MSKVVELKYPIHVVGKDGKVEAVNQLKFGRLKAKHIELLPDKFFESEDSSKMLTPTMILPLIAGLCNISVDAVKEIDMEDFIIVGEAMASFLGASLGTGKT